MPRIAQVCMLATALLSSALTLGASTAFTFECDRNSGFKMDPNEHKRVGYITALKGLGTTSPITFTPDLKVTLPFPGSSPPAPTGGPAPAKAPALSTVNVVGIIESFQWDGTVGSPIKITFYVSQQNAYQIKAAQQQTLKTTKIDQLGWWIADYDQETKKWYAAAYPADSRPISGIVGGKENPDLNVDVTGVPVVKGGTLYKVSMSVSPAANLQYNLRLANSSEKNVVKSWGLVVGSLAKTPLGK